MSSPSNIRSFSSFTLGDTRALAARIAPLMQQGDIIALSGPLGVGKSEFARSLIRALLNDETQEVPSPTFTLVQHYQTPAEESILHADLYRLSDESELYELAIDEDKDGAILIVEWPDRLPLSWQQQALGLFFNHCDKQGPDGDFYRQIDIKGNSAWGERLVGLRE